MFFSFPKIKLDNFVLANTQNIFLPYGIILFSLVGWNAVPEIEKILVKKEKLKKVIFLGIIISIAIYFSFGLTVSGVAGPKTTPDAFQGLIPVLGDKIILLGAIFGLFCVSTSFLILANYLKNTLRFDYQIPRLIASSIACFIPFLLFLIGIREFVFLVVLIGALMGLVEGTIICLVYKKAREKGERKPEYTLNISNNLLYSVIVILVLGTVSQIIYYFN